MGNFLVSLGGVLLGFVLIKYRERVAEIIGEAQWMHKVGGVYNLILICSILIIFFSLAKMTGTTDIFLSPLLFIIPGGRSVPEPPAF
jgi:hypothetical protein